jgi:hypothetical protein
VISQGVLSLVQLPADNLQIATSRPQYLVFTLKAHRFICFLHIFGHVVALVGPYA